MFPIGRATSTLLDMGLFAVFGMVCIGTNLVHGFAGKITLAQAAFLGIGAYVSVLLDTGREIAVAGVTMTLPNLPFLLAIAIAGLTCMVFSVLIGFPALRVQGPWLAFVTLAFNLLVFLVLNNEEGLTEGSRGIRILRDDVIVFGIDLSPAATTTTSASRSWWRRPHWCGGSFAVHGVDRSRRCVTTRHAPPASASTSARTRCWPSRSAPGWPAWRVRCTPRLIEFVDPRGFYIGQSFDFFLATVVGGLGTLVGPFIGVSFITVLTDRLRVAGDYYRVWFGLFVVVMMLVAPKGVAGSFNELRARCRSVARRRRDVRSRQTDGAPTS